MNPLKAHLEKHKYSKGKFKGNAPADPMNPLKTSRIQKIERAVFLIALIVLALDLIVWRP